MQNKVIRFLLNVGPRTHIGLEQFKQVNMLPVSYRVDQLKLNHMYNITMGKAPVYLTADVKCVRNHNNHNTRNSQTAYVAPRVGSMGLASFLYTGITRWNKLPTHIQKCTSKSGFKIKLKTFLWSTLGKDLIFR